MSRVQEKDDGGETLEFMDMGDIRTPAFGIKTDDELKKIFDGIPEFKHRDDDVMLCTFAKTGTNWMYEVLMMLLRRKAERVDLNKSMTMLELQGVEDVDKVPSPRVINCHLPPRFLPKDLAQKKIKTVLCLRNPKDTAVSYFNHMRGIKMYNYGNGQWKNWMRPYVQGKYEYGPYPAYLNEWQEVIEAGPRYPIHVMFFEDLKMNGMKEIERLISFLEIDISDSLQRDILDMCGFQKMAADKMLIQDQDGFFNENFRFFRKGEVGDWKNWFTVEQNEYFDSEWNKQIRADTIFQFKYTHSQGNS
ncbi:sulfotransferase 1A1-like [Mya arenaria]|uniref:sulfotransferase 1A1-like n=1 Tax=Mya arenaria TaxID=6604 RepID=UPI0022E10AC2|nr:sulfotransferase 1A1-like [Mya arenaria]